MKDDAPDAGDRLQQLLDTLARLEAEIEEEVRSRSDDVVEDLVERREHLEREMREARDRIREGVSAWLRHSAPRNVLSAPFIYAMIVPIVLIDLSFTLYQWICFPLYRIPRVRRARYLVIDRHRLPYLNAIEKLNCVYCGYANGVLAYAQEIAGCTEQYWCPIKHARRAAGAHRRYGRFLEWGDATDYDGEVERLRGELTGRLGE